MTERVDFYVLKSAAAKQRWAFACRLAEKAYLKDLRVVIVNDSLSDAQALDDMLWTFNDRSFVPHQLCTDERAPDSAAAVQLCVEPAAPAADPGVIATLAFAFLGGLILNLMPCVFPILAMKAVGVARLAGQIAPRRDFALCGFDACHDVTVGPGGEHRDQRRPDQGEDERSQHRDGATRKQQDPVADPVGHRGKRDSNQQQRDGRERVEEADHVV